MRFQKQYCFFISPPFSLELACTGIEFVLSLSPSLSLTLVCIELDGKGGGLSLSLSLCFTLVCIELDGKGGAPSSCMFKAAVGNATM